MGVGDSGRSCGCDPAGLYLARDTKLGRKVALKLVKPGALGTLGEHANRGLASRRRCLQGFANGRGYLSQDLVVRSG